MSSQATLTRPSVGDLPSIEDLTIENLTRREFISGALAAALLIACGDDDDGRGEGSNETRSFEHLGGVSQIPIRPQRIVTIQDQNALLPLLELSVRPIASAGVANEDGTFFFRRTEGFDTSGISFVGDYLEPDLELVTSQQPDLIIGYRAHLEVYDQLSAIAPTILLDVFDKPLDEALRAFADAVGALDSWQELKDRYDEAVAQFIDDLPRPPEEITLSCIYVDPEANLISPAQGYHSVNTTLIASRLARPAAETNLEPDTSYSFEQIAQHDADVMITAYFEDTPDADPVIQYLDDSAVFQSLDVVQRGEFHPFNGNLLVGSSFEKMHANLDFLRSILIDREVTFPD